MRAVELARPLADPEEVRRARVPVARRRVTADERLLVVEQERLVARPDVDLVDRPLVAEIDADRLHEAERAADLVRDHLVAPSLERARDELLVPRVHLREVGEPALRERAQEVERRDGLVVGLHHPLGVGHTRRLGLLVRMNGMPAERRQLHPAHALGRRRARLRELPGDPPHLDHGEGRAVGQHRGHLQEHLQPLPDRDRRDVPERLRAVARLEQERAALDRLAERPEQRPCLAREHERWQLAESPAHRLDDRGVGPVGLLERGARSPRGRRPGLGNGHASSVSRGRFDASRRKTLRYGDAEPRPPHRLLARERADMSWRPGARSRSFRPRSGRKEPHEDLLRHPADG